MASPYSSTEENSPIIPRVNSFFTLERRRPSQISAFKSKVHCIGPTSSSSYILSSLDFITAFIGNVYRSRYRRLAMFGLVLWTVDIVVNFSFDFYEAHEKYGFAWATVKVVEWMMLCTGTYFVIFKTVPWMKDGLQKLENDRNGINYSKSLFKITMDVKRLQVFLLVFTIIGSTVQYLIIRLADKSSHVTFNQSLSSGAVAVLHICRFISGMHVLYAYCMFWYVASCVMVMTGHSMVEFQERISTKLRSKMSSPTFREAVTMFDERLKFVKSSSRSCVVILFLLLSLTLLSVMVNVYLFLYKNRYILYIWHALMPLGLAIYPMCTAAWVTKQYHWYFVVVVKAWAEYPEDSTSDTDSDNETAEPKDSIQQLTRETVRSPDSSSMRIHVPETGHVTEDEPTDEQNREKWRNILRGSIRVIGRLQRQRKMARFNFEKYVSYLHHVAPTSGFKIGVLTITWEKVSASIFLLTSVVAVFLQEIIFGVKSKV